MRLLSTARPDTRGIAMKTGDVTEPPTFSHSDTHPSRLLECRTVKLIITDANYYNKLYYVKKVVIVNVEDITHTHNCQPYDMLKYGFI